MPTLGKTIVIYKIFYQYKLIEIIYFKFDIIIDSYYFNIRFFYVIDFLVMKLL